MAASADRKIPASQLPLIDSVLNGIATGDKIDPNELEKVYKALGITKDTKYENWKPPMAKDSLEKAVNRRQ